MNNNKRISRDKLEKELMKLIKAWICDDVRLLKFIHVDRQTHSDVLISTVLSTPTCKKLFHQSWFKLAQNIIIIACECFFFCC